MSTPYQYWPLSQVAREILLEQVADLVLAYLRTPGGWGRTAREIAQCRAVWKSEALTSEALALLVANGSVREINTGLGTIGYEAVLVDQRPHKYVEATATCAECGKEQQVDVLPDQIEDGRYTEPWCCPDCWEDDPDLANDLRSDR